MNIVFFGSSHFSAEVLDHVLKQGHRVSLVVTQHARPAGRHYHEHSTEVETVARQKGLAVHAPFAVNEPGSLDTIRSINADIFIVISYGQILSGELLSCARIVPMAIHPSLLPKYRGASPINTALLRGDSETGVTFIKMNAKMDAGEIILQEPIPIDIQDTTITLTRNLITLSCGMLDTFFDLVKNNKLRFTPQDNSRVSFAPKLSRQQARIDWQRSAEHIHNHIRGMLPWPIAYTTFGTEHIKIYESDFRPDGSKNEPGTIVQMSHEGINVACVEGILVIKKLQRPGKRVLSAQEFIQGAKVKVGDKFD